MQTSNPRNDMPSFGVNFDGLSSTSDKSNGPPNDGGAVGANDYVQVTDGNFAVYSKQAALLYGPARGSTLWQGFSGPCGSDGVFSVHYDEQAGRWITSGIVSIGGGGSYECIAVSQTGDPLGAWYRYAFQLSSGQNFAGNQSFGIWPDAYYMSASLGNAEIVYAFDRAPMLAGQQAQDVSFTLDSQYANVEPSDAEGGALGANPPSGAPDPFFMSCNAANGGACTGDELDLWNFHVDWATPANSTFGSNLAPSQALPVDAFDSNLCDYNPDCVPQPGTPQGLDPVSDKLMSPATYRNLGGTQAIVLNQTVNVSPNPSMGNQAGIRWYELTSTGSDWTVGQQGTYAPDGASRWMGSASIDASGDIAIGYSLSSSSVYPSIAVAGRLARDPAGQLTQGETTMIAGGGSQTYQPSPGLIYGDDRWGPTSSMQIDPSDGCTFWFTSEYVPVTNPSNDNIRTGSFRFPGCTAGQRGTVSGTVTDAGTGKPVAGATVTTSLGTTITDSQGSYGLVLPVGSYDVKTSAFDYPDGTAPGVQVGNGAAVTQNFSLTAIPTVSVTGKVTDGSGHGYPLYARIDFPGRPGGPVLTSPATGEYTVSLPQNETFRPTITATLPGYQAATPVITTGTTDATQDVKVQVDAAACTAPGYRFAFGAPTLNETFDDYPGDGGTAAPPGWSVVDNAGTGRVWTFDSPGGLGNATGGSGFFAAANDFQYHDFTPMDTFLISPVLDLSGDTTPVLRFNTDYRASSGPQTAAVDVSTDGGQTWATVWHPSNNVSGPDLEQVPMPQAAGQSNVQMRFHFVSKDGQWWSVDNVNVANQTCDPVPGGLMTGTVTDANTGNGVGGVPVTLADSPALTETFDDYSGDGGSTPPPGWTIEDNQGNGEVWTFNDPGAYGNRTGGTANFATINSYQFPVGDAQDTSLISPVISLSGETDPVLSFNSDFQNVDNQTASVDLSTDGGQTWTNVWQQQNYPGLSGPDLERVSIPQAAGQNSVQIRFHYTGTSVAYSCCGTFAGWWQIDNVTIAQSAIRVTTTSSPLTRGPSLPVGFYQFFDPLTGSHSFTAAESGYVTATKTVNVAPDATAEADFNLAAPRLSVSTPDITSSQVLGSTTTTKLTITNTGTAPASVTLDQRNGISQVLSEQGAPLNLVHSTQPPAVVAPVNGSSVPAGSGTTAGGASTASTPSGGVPAGLAWSPIAPYPTTIQDNTTARGGGTVYSVGGYTSSNGFLESLNTAYAYNTSLNSWTQLHNMPQTLDKPGAAFVNGKLYVSAGGGGDVGRPVASTYAYDPQTNTWSSLAANPHPTAAPGVAVAGSTIYFVGGCTDFVLSCNATPQVVAYSTATGTWSTLAPYPHPIAWESCGGINGKIYCAGGASDTGYDVDGYVYDPSANTWTPIAAMPTSVWGSAYDAASGLLVITGGVFGGLISNQGLAYDPTTNTWTALPNNYYSVYRTGGACGFYQIGGDDGGFNPQAVSEQLPGLSGCAGTSLPWLQLSGATATLQPGQSTTVTVTLAATTAAKVTQPGTFTAQLGIENNTPYTVSPVNVTMTVMPPSGWGEVTGTVTGTTCAGTTGPVAGAQVQAIGKKYTIGLTADIDGRYTLWAPSASNPYQIVASRNGWAPKAVTENIQSGGTVTANFTLSPVC